jgi:hypothetical protein
MGCRGTCLQLISGGGERRRFSHELHGPPTFSPTPSTRLHAPTGSDLHVQASNCMSETCDVGTIGPTPSPLFMPYTWARFPAPHVRIVVPISYRDATTRPRRARGAVTTSAFSFSSRPFRVVSHHETYAALSNSNLRPRPTKKIKKSRTGACMSARIGWLSAVCSICRVEALHRE